MYRSPSSDRKELLAQYVEEGDHDSVGDEDGTSEEYDLDSECSEEGQCGKGIRSALSLEIYGLQRECREQQVYFSNQEYYRRLEELKSAHLRNMAELERMYISQSLEGGRDLGCGKYTEAAQPLRSLHNLGGPARRLQRINSQEELEFHESSSGSDQSELFGDGSLRELELDNPKRVSSQDSTFLRGILQIPEERPIYKQQQLQPKTSCPKPRGRLACQTAVRGILQIPEERPNYKQQQFQPKTSCPKPRGRLACQTAVRLLSSSKVTVPKPFQMMLREEEKKQHKVRTRSEVELENTLLRQELEELRECQKKFRASPAPAHTHLPLYKVISRRFGQRPTQSRTNSNSNQISQATSQQPFHFLERERRKREAKIVAELANLGSKDDRKVFKAKPMPTSVYSTKRKGDAKSTSCQPQTSATCTVEREATDGQSSPSSDLELDTFHSVSDTYDGGAYRPQRCPSTRPVKKQIQLSIEMVKEQERSSLKTLKAKTCNICPGRQQPLVTTSSNYINV